eukprot:gb/GECG01011356.1/.p1 GENE.gb/GECG01011356.1/~~gb/GECG01011356.1/.p1  ORF type:complete len:133 (+),score=31.39 gb/GECG01011356.1/:1-399(+)
MDSSNLEEQENQGSAASATAANSNMNMRGGARGTCILLDANGADITNNKEAASNKGGESLREAFERFRREKQRAAKVEKKSGTAAKKRLNDTEEGRVCGRHIAGGDILFLLFLGSAGKVTANVSGSRKVVSR